MTRQQNGRCTTEVDDTRSRKCCALWTAHMFMILVTYDLRNDRKWQKRNEPNPKLSENANDGQRSRERMLWF